MDLNHRRREK